MRNRRLDHPRRADEPAPVALKFEGSALRGRIGEPWAYTLLAHGIYILGRSAKYHRPRGMFCGTGSCGQCVARIEGLPNRRLCMNTPASGDNATSQNALGSARYDALGIIDGIFFRGLDHHRLMTHTGPLNAIAVGTARFLAGLGKLPAAALPASLGVGPIERHVQVAIVGGGAAGQAAAAATRAAGLITCVLDPQSIAHHPDDIPSCRILGFYDDRMLVGSTPNGQVRLQADAIMLCTGAYEQPPSCPGNDRPGVMSLRAAERALGYGILPGRNVAVAVAPEADAATRRRAWVLVESLRQAGVELPIVAGLPAFGLPKSRLARIRGSAPNLHLKFTEPQQTITATALVWCGRPTPAYELPRQMGIDAPFSLAVGGFVPRHGADGATARDGIYVAGEVCGVDADNAASHGTLVGQAVAQKHRRANLELVSAPPGAPS